MVQRAAALVVDGVDVHRCVRILITITVGELARIDRRAAYFKSIGKSAYASRSGALRADGRAARMFHHDAKSPINALSLTSQALRRGHITAIEAADAFDRGVCELKLLASEA